MANLSRRDAGKALLAGYASLMIGGRHALGSVVDSPIVETLGQQVHESKAVSQPATGSQSSSASTWSDALLVEGDSPTVSYRTNWVVYEESLMNGQLVGRGWNGAGFIISTMDALTPASIVPPKPSVWK